MEGSLILVKHAMPELDGNSAPKDWELGDKGFSQSKKFANFLRDNLDVDPVMFSSEETKAKDTAMILSETLGLELKTLPELGEIDRVPHALMDEEDHIEYNKKIFENQSQAVVGSESAEAALARFESAIKKVLEVPLEEERVVVTHGTVISLFLDKYNEEIDAFDVWQKFGCPSYVVISVPDYKVLELNGKPLSN